MARSTVAILNASPAPVPGDHHASMTLAVLAPDRSPFFEWCFRTMLALSPLAASVLSQPRDSFSRRVRRLMAPVSACQPAGVTGAPEFASRRWHPLPPPA